MSSFAERIEEQIKKSGRTIVDLADEIGISRNTLLRWKRGQIAFLYNMQRAAQVFGCSEKYLIGDDRVIRPKIKKDRKGIAMRICQKMEECGIKRKIIANACGVCDATVSSWKIGKKYPNKENLEKIAKLFDCSEEWLKWGSEENGQE